MQNREMFGERLTRVKDHYEFQLGRLAEIRMGQPGFNQEYASRLARLDYTFKLAKAYAAYGKVSRAEEEMHNAEIYVRLIKPRSPSASPNKIRSTLDKWFANVKKELGTVLGTELNPDKFYPPLWGSDLD